MSVYVGTSNATLPGVVKIYYGSMLVYQEKSPLCFTASADDSAVSYTTLGTVTTSGIQYSTDGSTWAEWDGSEITLASEGDKVCIRNTNSALSTSTGSYLQFVMSGSIAASGNINSLLNYSDPSECSFCYLFQNCTALVTPPEMPSTVLAKRCYYRMYNGCTSLTSAPVLPITTLADNCCSGMFLGCTSLHISDTSQGATEFFTCPTPAEGVSQMFSGTGGTYTADPEAGSTYYYT